MTARGFIIGIDASNLRRGGGVTHLVELCRAIDISAVPAQKVIVWGGRQLLERLPDRPWLVKSHQTLLDGNVLQRTFWQDYRLDRLAEGHVDVLFVPGGRFSGKFRPYVTFCQNLLPFDLEERSRYGFNTKNFWRLRLLQYAQAETFYNSEGVIFLSTFSRHVVEERVGRLGVPCPIIHHGVSDRFRHAPRPARKFTEFSEKNPFRLVYVSILDVYKHQWVVVDAVGELRRRGLPIELTLVGPAYGPSERRTREAMRRNDPAGAFIRYIGNVDYSEIQQRYVEAEGVVFASSCETFGMIVLEAMAAGLPIVCSNRSSMPEVLGEAGLYFDPLAPESLAPKLERLVRDHALRDTLATKAFQRAKEFNWERCARETFSFICGAAESSMTRQHGMRVLQREWDGGFLDYCTGPGQVRIAVHAWQELERISDAFVRYPKNWRKLLNYLIEVGVINVVRRLNSRLHEERFRNVKFLSVGVGVVESPDAGGRFAAGDYVVFVAPIHPRCVNRVSLAVELIERLPAEQRERFSAEQVAYFGPSTAGRFPPPPAGLSGWRDESGWPVPAELGAFLRECAQRFLPPELRPQHLLPALRGGYATSAGRSPVTAVSQKRGVVIGYGNYAKVTLIPNLDRRVRIVRIHEMDPVHLSNRRGESFQVSSSPVIESTVDNDVYFIASFHDSHAPLASQVLQAGKIAVVEKPLATTFTQLESLEQALRANPQGYFACFQKRYHHFNEMAWRDLGVQRGEAVHYHCSVFEIPLPKRHWYNWPNSGTRIISNGCHWIDHFLFLNHYSAVTRREVTVAKNDDLLVFLELANGANFSMLLTDTGSSRIGMQEVVELRANQSRVTIRNASAYQAETEFGMGRSSSVNRLDVYGHMYREISRRIAVGLPGDDVANTLACTRVVLELDEMARQIISARRA